MAAKSQTLQAMIAEYSDRQLQEKLLIQLVKQNETLGSIKNSIIFFVVLTIISLGSAFVLLAS